MPLVAAQLAHKNDAVQGFRGARARRVASSLARWDICKTAWDEVLVSKEMRAVLIRAAAVHRMRGGFRLAAVDHRDRREDAGRGRGGCAVGLSAQHEAQRARAGRAREAVHLISGSLDLVDQIQRRQRIRAAEARRRIGVVTNGVGGRSASTSVIFTWMPMSFCTNVFSAPDSTRNFSSSFVVSVRLWLRSSVPRNTRFVFATRPAAAAPAPGPSRHTCRASRRTCNRHRPCR